MDIVITAEEAEAISSWLLLTTTAEKKENTRHYPE